MVESNCKVFLHQGFNHGDTTPSLIPGYFIHKGSNNEDSSSCRQHLRRTEMFHPVEIEPRALILNFKRDSFRGYLAPNIHRSISKLWHGFPVLYKLFKSFR